MEWFNIGAFSGGILMTLIGFVIGWWGRGQWERKKGKE